MGPFRPNSIGLTKRLRRPIPDGNSTPLRLDEKETKSRNQTFTVRTPFAHAPSGPEGYPPAAPSPPPLIAQLSEPECFLKEGGHYLWKAQVTAAASAPHLPSEAALHTVA